MCETFRTLHGNLVHCRAGNPVPRSIIWDRIYSAMVDRVRRQGFVDTTLRADTAFSALSDVDIREDALDAAAYVARLARPSRTISSEEYYLVLELALRVGIDCGLHASALSAAERAEVEGQLVRVLKPHASWVGDDLSTGPYASVANIWPLSALRKHPK